MKIVLFSLVTLASAVCFGRLVQGVDQDAFHPAPQHVLLQKQVGTWDAVLIAKNQAGVEARTKGTRTTVKLADFHTVDTFEGEFMGMTMLGHGVNGYCTARKQFFTFWADSMTPSPMTLFGDYDDQKRELTMTGECLGMSGKLEKCQTVTSFQDDHHIAWVLFGFDAGGKRVQHLRIEYTRKS